ncbi:hypothetical protein F5888DRAFT_1711630 [Russula emetica]|nr:hypothetical protein F5888DRAFT_1711630 [Russula emetica]
MFTRSQGAFCVHSLRYRRGKFTSFLNFLFCLLFPSPSLLSMSLPLLFNLYSHFVLWSNCFVLMVEMKMFGVSSVRIHCELMHLLTIVMTNRRRTSMSPRFPDASFGSRAFTTDHRSA